MQLRDLTLTIMSLAIIAVMGLQAKVLSRVPQEPSILDMSDVRQNLLNNRPPYPDGRWGGGGNPRRFMPSDSKTEVNRFPEVFDNQNLSISLSIARAHYPDGRCRGGGQDCEIESYRFFPSDFEAEGVDYS